MPKTAEDVTLRDLCKTACNKTPDTESAIKHVRRQLEGNPELAERLQQAMLDHAIRSTVYEVRSSIQADIKYPPTETERGGAIIAAAARTIQQSYLRVVFGGKYLRDMTGAELDDQIERHRGIASGAMRNSVWLSLIRKNVGVDDVVGDKIDETTAATLWSEACQPGSDTQIGTAAPRKLQRGNQGSRETQPLPVPAHSLNGTGHAKGDTHSSHARSNKRKRVAV